MRHLCPSEVITLKCDHEALRNGNKFKDVIWKVNDSRRNWQWTQVTYCSESLECKVTESKAADGIKVLNISKGTITIERLSRNATIRDVDFMCVIETQEKPHKHRVRINLAVECKLILAVFDHLEVGMLKVIKMRENYNICAVISHFLVHYLIS